LRLSEYRESLWGGRRHRPLTRSEELLARKVFAASLPYDCVRFADAYLPGIDVPVTLASTPFRRRTIYTIHWGDGDVFDKGADACGNDERASLIHELTHVWQGHHGAFAQGYMLKSFAAQGFHGVRDVMTARRWRGWACHRRRAYDYTRKLGQSWKSFNVEQQAAIVEDWFREWMKSGLTEAGEPTGDARHAYIEQHIRARSGR